MILTSKAFPAMCQLVLVSWSTGLLRKVRLERSLGYPDRDVEV